MSTLTLCAAGEVGRGAGGGGRAEVGRKDGGRSLGGRGLVHGEGKGGRWGEKKDVFFYLKFIGIVSPVFVVFILSFNKKYISYLSTSLYMHIGCSRWFFRVNTHDNL